MHSNDPPEPKYHDVFSNMTEDQAIQYLMTLENNTEERANERYNNWLYSIEEPKQHFESYVWDAYKEPPPKELIGFPLNKYFVAVAKIKSQPFFGGHKEKTDVDWLRTDKSKIQPAKE